MTIIKWTRAQERRLKELGLDPGEVQKSVSDPRERDRLFRTLEKSQVKDQRRALKTLLSQTCKTQIKTLGENLEKALYQEGFTGVTTPTIITAHALKKMSIDQDHPLSKQIFWLNNKQCLRPMLAPNLYSLMQDFSRLNHSPVRFFEIGSCFRKESSGARHANEFTMLNLVEMGVDPSERRDRLEYLANTIMAAAEVKDYCFETEDSKVYGSTLDLVAGEDRTEVASGAMGPHSLDGPWGVTETWVGMGFGLERLIMISNKDTSIGKWVKSLSYLDGISLKI